MARATKKESALTLDEKLAQALVPEEEQPYKIPDNWCWTTLKQICLDFIVPQRDKPKVFDGNIPWCRIEDIEGKQHGFQNQQINSYFRPVNNDDIRKENPLYSEFRHYENPKTKNAHFKYSWKITQLRNEAKKEGLKHVQKDFNNFPMLCNKAIQV